MKRYSLHWLIAAGCALGAAGCAGDDTETPPDRVAVSRQAVSQDVTPPDVVCSLPGDCALSTTNVDVTAGPAAIDVTARFVDSPSGLQVASVVYVSPSGAQQAYTPMLGTPVSGTPQDGRYTATLTIPKFAEAGQWTLSHIWVMDEANNSTIRWAPELLPKGFPGTISVTSPGGDAEAPQVDCLPPLGECALSATSVDTHNGPVPLGVTVHFRDSPSGLQVASVVYVSPSGTQQAYAPMLGPPVSGTPQEGTYHGTLTIPQFAEAGQWHLSHVWVMDNANNSTIRWAPALLPVGFPGIFTVDSEGDTTPPTVVCPGNTECTISADNVDPTVPPGTVDVRARFQDSPAGLQMAAIYYTSPSGGQQALAPLVYAPEVGTPQDGRYVGTLTIPPFAEYGVWKMNHVWAMDKASNSTLLWPQSLPANFPFTLHVCHGNDGCNDANACTVGESCNAGHCGGGAQLDCSDGDVCTADSCDPVTGCAHTALSCDDGNPCTNDACHPAFGCTHTPNSAACDDGDGCTTGDHCAAGACVGGPPLSCDDGNPCTDDSCKAGGACVHDDREGACDDGNPCTAGEVCKSGACVAQSPVTCDDGEECTVDSCDPQVGCVFAPRAGSCGPPPSGCASGGVCFAGHCTVGSVCGDTVCCTEGGENHCTCPQDCPNPPGVPECGNGCCGANEDACNCPEDCQPVPNDGKCCGNESRCESADCGPEYCGDGCCGAGETSCSCPGDCGTKCHDGCCGPGEDACNCPEDCQPQVGDGLCCGSEDSCNSKDCGPDTCGNGCCGPDETPCSCPADCGQVVCGDGTCAGCGEDRCSCPEDCGEKIASPCAADCGSKCGDGCCGIMPDGTPENACNCNTDCATTCGDGCCSGDETSCSCPQDCGATKCGNGKCEPCAGETPCGCPSDCGSGEDGVCCGGENGCTAPDDCGPPALHNHLCEGCNGETSCNAPDDCTPVCGDGCCNGEENGCNCKIDCGAPGCGNDLCEPECEGETACSCPADCGGPEACGDGLCCGGETSCGCVADCGGVVHGDSQCCANESPCDEAACGPIVGGDGLCCPSENWCGEPTCGPGTCGDGCCGPTETFCGCPADCAGSPPPPVCVTIQRGLSGNVADAFLAGDDPQWATGAEQNLWIGQTPGGNENRSLYRFDLSGVPQGATLTSATLRVWLSSNGATATIKAHSLLAPWIEATVSKANYGDPAFIDAAEAGSFFEDGSGGYKSMDVKSLVAAWVSGAKANHGLVLMEPPTAVHHTFSSESSQSVRPKLEVCYVSCGP